MDRQMGEILRKQEQQEQKAYRSAEMLVDMMQSDFVNSTAVLSMLDQNAAHLPELFRLTDAPVWPFDGKAFRSAARNNLLRPSTRCARYRTSTATMAAN